MFGLFKKSAGAEIIFTGGNIYTQDPDAPFAEAVACKDGLIMAVGSADLIEQFQTKNTKVVDLEGGFLLPGFIDAGGHPVLRAFQEVCLILNDDMSLEDVTLALTEYIANNPEKQSYFAYGFHFGLISSLEREEAQKLLDEIRADKPIAVLDSSGFQGWFNSEAVREVKKAAEEDARKEDEEDAAPPALTLTYILNVLSPIDFDKLREAIVFLAAEYCARGYTTVFDCGSPDYFQSVYQEILVEALQEDLLKQRFLGSLLVTRSLDVNFVVGRLMQKKTNCMEIDNFINFNTLKLVIDTTDAPEKSISPDALKTLARAASERGFDVHIDAAGREGLAAAFAAAAFSRAAGYNHNRFTIAHADGLTREETEDAPDDDPALFETDSTIGAYSRPLRDIKAESVQEAIDRLTIEAAEQLGVSNRYGSVAVNKKADFAVFKEYPLSSDLAGFHVLSAAMTVVDGKIVYDADEDRPEDWLKRIASRELDAVDPEEDA